MILSRSEPRPRSQATAGARPPGRDPGASRAAAAEGRLRRKTATQVVDRVGLALRMAIVGLTLATALIHLSLGGPLFTANAVGYAVLAVAMVVPIRPAVSARWLIRLALAGFTVATIGGWALFGPRFPLAYLDKAIEVVLLVALAIEVVRYDGGPVGVARRLVTTMRGAVALVLDRRPAA